MARSSSAAPAPIQSARASKRRCCLGATCEKPGDTDAGMISSAEPSQAVLDSCPHSNATECPPGARPGDVVCRSRAQHKAAPRGGGGPWRPCWGTTRALLPQDTEATWRSCPPAARSLCQQGFYQIAAQESWSAARRASSWKRSGITWRSKHKRPSSYSCNNAFYREL